MMRAIVLTSFSGVNGLELAEVADPIPAEGEQLVHVRAASLGPWDVESAEGAFAARGGSVDFPRFKAGILPVRPTTGSGSSGSSRSRG
jgi:NADPH:quinone reductase-like Zn-dependent oxidoreductase